MNPIIILCGASRENKTQRQVKRAARIRLRTNLHFEKVVEKYYECVILYAWDHNVYNFANAIFKKRASIIYE